MSAAFLAVKAVVCGGIIVAVGELAKRNNTAASIVHSLPLVSVLALVWLFADTRDTALIARHAQGTFWFVLPTLLRRGVGFWPSLALCLVLTTVLYFLTMRLLKAAGVTL